MALIDLKKKHAEHNERACNFLHEDGNYPDWVVTTAFYSALHFVQHEIFPTTIGSRTYTTFDNYYNSHFQRIQNKPNRHVATINLVYSELGDDVGGIYEWLHDICRTARYRNFNTNPMIAELSRKRLAEIKDYLNK